MSPRFSTLRHSEIEYCFWLVFDAQGGMRLSRGEPTVGRDERAMSCSCKLPKTLFRTPTLSAQINVTEGGSAAFSIDVAAASDALKTALGVDIDLQVTTSAKDPTS